MRPHYAPAVRMVSVGAIVFRAVYERWPSSWQEVTDSGLVQVGLKTEEGLPISPDDGVIDFVGDVSYIPPQDDELPKIAIQMFVGDGPMLLSSPINTNQSYRRWFERVPEEFRHRMPHPSEARFR